MSTLYGLACSGIAVRLLLFQRGPGKHRPRVACLAWLLIVACASVPIRLALHEPVPVDPASLLLATLVLVAVWVQGGNVTELLRSHRYPGRLVRWLRQP